MVLLSKISRSAARAKCTAELTPCLLFCSGIRVVSADLTYAIRVSHSRKPDRQGCWVLPASRASLAL
jgi:hypothetical protein